MVFETYFEHQIWAIFIFDIPHKCVSFRLFLVSGKFNGFISNRIALIIHWSYSEATTNNKTEFQSLLLFIIVF